MSTNSIFQRAAFLRICREFSPELVTNLDYVGFVSRLESNHVPIEFSEDVISSFECLKNVLYVRGLRAILRSDSDKRSFRELVGYYFARLSMVFDDGNLFPDVLQLMGIRTGKGDLSSHRRFDHARLVCREQVGIEKIIDDVDLWFNVGGFCPPSVRAIGFPQISLDYVAIGLSCSLFLLWRERAVTSISASFLRDCEDYLESLQSEFEVNRDDHCPNHVKGEEVFLSGFQRTSTPKGEGVFTPGLSA